MLADVLALILLQLAAGVVLWTLLTPSKDLSGGFFALHEALAAACLFLSWLVSGKGGFLLGRGSEESAVFAGGPAGVGRALSAVFAPGVLLAVAVVTASAAALLARLGSARSLTLSKNLLFLSVLSSLALLLSRAHAEPFASRPGIGAVWLAGGLVLGALFLGCVIWAMNLGHWYLVSKTLPFRLLLRATEVFAVLALARAVYAAVALGLVARSSGSGAEPLSSLLDPMRDGFFFWSRVLWGLAAPLVLAPFVVKTARMKSNQAATGLLYVGLVFVLVGELLAAYLTLRSGLPV